MKKLSLAVLVLLTFTSVLSALTYWKPSETTIRKIESGIHPQDISGWEASDGRRLKLSAYARYYVGYEEKGQKLIHGKFVMDGIDKKPGIYILDSEDDMPMIDGGGCAIINVSYAVETSRIDSISCNGNR